MAFVIGRLRINKPFADWQKVFLEHAPARREAGIVDIFHAPVIGEQAVVYIVRTDTPRAVHDMMWAPDAREVIGSSGHVEGSETFTICDEPPGAGLWP